MAEKIFREFSDSDVSFLIETITPRLMVERGSIRSDQSRIERMLEENEERLFNRITSIGDEEVLIRISPRFLFEILLRRTAKILQRETYIFERIGTHLVPIFDAKKAGEFVARKLILVYLTDMLASFTRIESFTLPIRSKKGVWRRIRFNDIDIESLISLCQIVNEEYRFPLYKRIADVCLFISGIFPEYLTYQHRYPVSGQVRRHMSGTWLKSLDEYEARGEEFYRLAAEHRAAEMIDLRRVLNEMAGNFGLAKKPLNFISSHYLQFKKHHLFSLDSLS